MRLKGRLKKLLVTVLVIIATLGVLDKLFPLALPANEPGRFARVVVDAEGKPLRAFADSDGIWRYQVGLNDVSPLYLEALINYEDRWFWHHFGVNPFAIARAAFQNIKSGRILSGGSTITMQVARLLHPHKRTMAGKLKQVLRTFQLEWHLSKQEILTLYLNIAPFGGTIEGVQAASFTYLEKSADDLSHAEAALLAVLPQAPTRYRPDIHADKAQKARDKVLDRMQQFGIWSAQTVIDAKMEQVFAYSNRYKQIAPLLSLRMLRQEPNKPVIETTIDGSLQLALEAHVKGYVEQLPEGTSAAMLVVDNQTAAVKAYLGSADFLDNSRSGHVDMVQASRSVGSTLKPFLFALAMEEGLIHSHSLLMDVPRSEGLYRPANFNRGFSGPVSASYALQQSLNVPFVDLLERYGPATFVDKLNSAGLTLDIPDDKANLAVILGGVGSSLERLVTGYTAFVGGGKTSELKFLKDAVKRPLIKRHLLSRQSAWIAYHTLAQITRPDGIQWYGETPGKKSLAWKTGTSYGYRDTWAIGVSKQHTIGVWLGRPDGTPLPGHSGRQTAGPLLFAVSDYLRDSLEGPEQPENVAEFDICWPLGGKVTDDMHCHQKHRAWIIDETIVPTWPGKDVWQVNPLPFWINPETGLRVNGLCEGQKQQKWAALWPVALEPWLPRSQRRAGQLPSADPACQGAQALNDNSLKIDGIEADSTYTIGGNTDVAPSILLKAMGGSGKQQWYINGKLTYSGIGPGGINHQFKSPGRKQLLVIDDAGNIDKTEIFARY